MKIKKTHNIIFLQHIRIYFILINPLMLYYFLLENLLSEARFLVSQVVCKVLGNDELLNAIY